jgi:hypothetical protein
MFSVSLLYFNGKIRQKTVPFRLLVKEYCCPLRLPQKRPFHGQPQYPVLRPDTFYKQPETDKKNQSPMCVEL